MGPAGRHWLFPVLPVILILPVIVIPLVRVNGPMVEPTQDGVGDVLGHLGRKTNALRCEPPGGVPGPPSNVDVG